jgi:GAF domain-containing protein
VCRAYVEVLGADHSGAALWEKGRDVGTVVAEYPAQGFIGVQIPIDNAFTRQVMETGEPQWAFDVRQDERLEATGPLLVGLGIRSIAVVPLVARGQVIATVGLDYMRAHHAFTPEELRLAQTIAQQAAVALENALLYEEAQRQARRIQTAAEIARIVVSVLDVEELLQQAVDLIRQRFDYYYVGAFLVDPSGEWAVLRAGTGEAGRRMVAQGHRLRVGGESMIGQACARRQPVIAQDVSEAEARYVNPSAPGYPGRDGPAPDRGRSGAGRSHHSGRSPLRIHRGGPGCPFHGQRGSGGGPEQRDALCRPAVALGDRGGRQRVHIPGAGTVHGGREGHDRPGGSGPSDPTHPAGAVDRILHNFHSTGGIP